MKKTLVLLLLAFCSNEVVVEEFEPINTTEVVVNTTIKFQDTDLMMDNFHKWWVEYKLSLIHI